MFMITGIGVHDRTDWPFTIIGMRRLRPQKDRPGRNWPSDDKPTHMIGFSEMLY
jgi:hypothetical protein